MAAAAGLYVGFCYFVLSISHYSTRAYPSSPGVVNIICPGHHLEPAARDP
jgi:hypothetical protein